MLGTRVIHLQEVKPASPLHWPWIKNRHVRDIVALIDARPAQAQRVSSNPAITPAPVTAAAAAPSGGAAFSSTGGGEALQPTVQRPINSRRVDQAPELHTLFFLRRVPLESWKGRWRFGTAWIGDDVMDYLVANSKAIRNGGRVFSPWFRVMPAAVNPQKPQNPPGEDVLAVVRALARLRARIDHDAEIARRSVQARATEPSA